MKPYILDGYQFSILKLNDVAQRRAAVSLSHQAKKQILRSRAVVERWVERGEIVYGVTT
ncbi:MAG: aromatic amino acid lyase, partial [Ignavibacteriales bacterium]|nr:aromatic amino acid lyase [Ignavibacteriales bacterium]